MHKDTSSINWKTDKWLAVMVVGLWSIGRVVNPLLRAYADASAPFGPWISGATVVYVVLHLVVFGYTFVAAVRSLKRHGLGMRRRALGEFVLYLYILITILLSLFFIAYQVGLLPDWAGNLLPYPFTIS